MYKLSCFLGDTLNFLLKDKIPVNYRNLIDKIITSKNTALISLNYDIIFYNI